MLSSADEIMVWFVVPLWHRSKWGIINHYTVTDSLGCIDIQQKRNLKVKFKNNIKCVLPLFANVGAKMGANVGAKMGANVGANVGASVGASVGGNMWLKSSNLIYNS